jgi:glycosyltransferase involved in cell wall biosynthesis
MEPTPVSPLKRKINILYIIDHIDGPGGTERHLSYLVTMLDKERFDCSIIVFDLVPNSLTDALMAKGIEVHHIPVARYYVPNAAKQARVISRYMKQRQIDIVQTYHYKADVYGSLIAWLSGVPRLISSKRDVADLKSRFKFFLHKLVRPLVDRYIVVSGVVADAIVRKEGASLAKIVKIYNGVNLASYRVPSAQEKGAAKIALGLKPDDFVIGMTAWMRPEKDHPLLLGAFKRLKERVPHAKLVLVGEGPHRTEYQEWAEANGLKDDIVFSGLADNVIPFVSAFDVACLVPKGNEGFSNSILEKMAMGLPLVVTNVGGNREAVAHGENGFVIEPGQQDALLQNLLRLVEDPSLLARMGQVSRQRVVELFSLEQMIERHQDLYISLVEGKGSRA